MQPALTAPRSLMPIETNTPSRRASLAIATTSGPGTSTLCSTIASNRSWLRIGAQSAVQTGNAGMQDSGKTISSAPCPAASRISDTAFSAVARRSRNTGAACAAATLTVGSELIVSLHVGRCPHDRPTRGRVEPPRGVARFRDTAQERPMPGRFLGAQGADDATIGDDGSPTGSTGTSSDTRPGRRSSTGPGSPIRKGCATMSSRRTGSTRRATSRGATTRRYVAGGTRPIACAPAPGSGRRCCACRGTGRRASTGATTRLG